MSHKETYLEQLMGICFTRDNRVTCLNNGERIFPAMLDAIHQSKASIELLTFIYWSGTIAIEFADALSERAKNGVKVRVLLDAFGSADMDRALVSQMQAAGVNVQWFRPLSKLPIKCDNRTHRKVLVCDARIAFTGGVGIASEWEGDARNPDEWRETHFQIEGPAVDGLRAAFWDNWMECEDLPKPPELTHTRTTKDGDTPLLVMRSGYDSKASDSYKVLWAMIELATKQLDIVSPYFVPPARLREEICAKSRHGVRVRILLPGAYTDKRLERLEASRYFNELLDAGVAIFLYQKTMIHTKLLICDDDLALFGSLNFNRRSLNKDEEVGVITTDTRLCNELRGIFEKDLLDAKLLNETDWSEPSWLEVLTHCLITPFRGQL